MGKLNFGKCKFFCEKENPLLFLVQTILRNGWENNIEVTNEEFKFCILEGSNRQLHWSWLQVGGLKDNTLEPENGCFFTMESPDLAGPDLSSSMLNFRAVSDFFYFFSSGTLLPGRFFHLFCLWKLSDFIQKGSQYHVSSKVFESQ